MEGSVRYRGLPAIWWPVISGLHWLGNICRCTKAWIWQQSWPFGASGSLIIVSRRNVLYIKITKNVLFLYWRNSRFSYQNGAQQIKYWLFFPFFFSQELGRMALRRFLKHSQRSGYVLPISVVSVATVGSSGMWLNYKNNSKTIKSNWSSLGAVRFGRAFFSVNILLLFFFYFCLSIKPCLYFLRMFRAKKIVFHHNWKGNVYRLLCHQNLLHLRIKYEPGFIHYCK